MQQAHRRNAVGMSPSAIPAEQQKRMVVFGAPAVGKTQIVSRFIGREPSEIYLPTAEDFHRMMYSIRGHTYELEILDTAGRVICPLMQKITVLTGDIFLVAYSITDRSSFERAKDIVDFIENVLGDPLRTHKGIERNFKNLMLHPKFIQQIENNNKPGSVVIPIVLAGNKIDNEAKRKVEIGEANQWLRARQSQLNGLTSLTHVEISAKNNVNITEMFERMFAVSSLPIEMSPALHRKVSENAYAICTHSEATDTVRKSQNRRSLKKKLSLKTMMKNKDEFNNSKSSSEESLHSDEPCERLQRSHSDESIEAVATARVNDRRPSVDTEVILALSKSRTYPLAGDSNKHGRIKLIGDHIKTFKKHVKTFAF